MTEREPSWEKYVLYTGIKSSSKSFLPLTYQYFLIESHPFFLQFLSKGNGKKTKQKPMHNFFKQLNCKPNATYQGTCSSN